MEETHCPVHPWGRIRPYRTTGPHGRGIYAQCVPANGEAPHLLEVQDPRLGRMHLAAVAPRTRSQARRLSQFLSHSPRPGPFADGRPDRVRAGRGR